MISYVAIRSDEGNRKGYVPTKPNIKAVFPFMEDGIERDDVMRILDEAGLNLPEYYEWRTRSGCYFCFFQRKAEWVGLADKHPDLFQKAIAIEQKTLKDAGVQRRRVVCLQRHEGRPVHMVTGRDARRTFGAAR